MRVLRGEGHGLPAKPVADVICVAVDEGDTHGQGEEGFEVVDEVGVDEVAGLLEGVGYQGRGVGVVDVDAEGVHDVVLFEVFVEVAWGGRFLSFIIISIILLGLVVKVCWLTLAGERMSYGPRPLYS